MKKVNIRFYEELNDFLPRSKRKIRFEIAVFGTPSVKDIIESQGVPHTEVDMILVNGKSARFTYRIQDDDDISVYPEFESFDISRTQKLRPHPLRRPKFILDVHLGALARYMRMLGLDAKYGNNLKDNEIIDISEKEKRAILTRDIGILKHSCVKRGRWVRNTNPVKQIEEIIERFDLKNEIKEFTRCIKCNTKLKPIKKEKALPSVPAKIRLRQTEFSFCTKCNKIYWKGSHYDKMNTLVNKIRVQQE